MIIYSKFNNHYRKEQYDLLTNIEDIRGRRYVIKSALRQKALPFLATIPRKYRYLKEGGFPFDIIAPRKKSKTQISFQFVEGRSLESIIFDNMVNGFRKKRVEDLIHQYIRAVKSVGLKTTRATKKFEEVFGAYNKQTLFVKKGCLDLNFDNIFVRGKNYFLIDYEWVFPFAIPLKYIVFRALYGFYAKYFSYNVNDILPVRGLLEKYHISQRDVKQFVTFEYNFQRYVSDSARIKIGDLGEYQAQVEKIMQMKNYSFENSIEKRDLSLLHKKEKIAEGLRKNKELQSTIDNLKTSLDNLKNTLRVERNNSARQRKKLERTKALVESLSRDITLMRSTLTWKTANRIHKSLIAIKLLFSFKMYKEGFPSFFQTLRDNGAKATFAKILKGEWLRAHIELANWVRLDGRASYNKRHQSEQKEMISVIIPIFDRRKMLIDSIESILKQTYKNFELILVTDGSPESTMKIVKRYGKHPRVRTFFYFNNTGNAVRGRNKGIKEARGEYIAFHDSDDIAEPNRLELSLKCMKESGADLVYGGWRALKDGTRKISIRHGQEILSPDCDLEKMKQACVLCQSTVMVKRKALLQVGGLKSEMRYCEDYELWLRLLHFGYKFKAIPLVLTNLRLHAGNNELKFKKNEKRWQKIALQQYRKKGKLPKKIVYVIPGVGISGGVAIISQHCNRLLKKGYDVLILSQEGDARISWMNNEVEIVKRSTKRKYLFDNIDILIATGWSTVATMHSIPAKRKIYFVQSDERRFFADKRAKEMIHKTYKSKCEYMTEARWIQRWLKKEFSHDSHYVPNGIDLNMFYKTKPLVRRGRKPRVLLEGPISIPFKGVATAYEAVKNLDCEIWFVSSSGKPRKNWRYDKLFFKVRQDKMREIYSSCDVLLKMSRVEGFFGPPMEAMACGCAVVVGKVTGYNEYIKDNFNGLVVEQDDIRGATRAVERLFRNNKLREKLVANGYKTVQEWSWEKTLKHLESVINKK